MVKVKFRDLLAFCFFSINMVFILFLANFTYDKMKQAILQKTKDQLLSINILKKRHIEHYLRETLEELMQFTIYFDHHESDTRELMDILMGVREVEGVVIRETERNITSDPKLLDYVLDNIDDRFSGEGSLYVLQAEGIIDNYSLIHFKFIKHNKRINVFLNKKGLDELVTERAGMGETGESYIVDEKHKLLTPSRFFPDSIPETIPVHTVGVGRALEGEEGLDIYNDYRGIQIIGAYREINFYDLNFVLLTEIDENEALQEIFTLKKYFTFVTFILLVASFIISVILSRVINYPISLLRGKSEELAKGVLPETLESGSVIREISEINQAINRLIIALQSTVLFAKEIGKENFQASYTLLSENDELGRAVLEMRTKLLALNEQKNQLEIQKKKDLVLTQERERERIARDIHDGIGPLLTTVKMKVSGLDLDERTKMEIIGIIENTIREIRSVSRNLMPGVLIDFGPAEAISTMVEDIRKQTGVNITFSGYKSTEHSHIGKDEGIALYRIAQEAINNALKHARASEIKISLTEFEEHISLFIRDNGCGFDSETLKTAEGKGLRNIEERVNILGGEFYIDTGEAGTTIEIDIPL